MWGIWKLINLRAESGCKTSVGRWRRSERVQRLEFEKAAGVEGWASRGIEAVGRGCKRVQMDAETIDERAMQWVLGEDGKISAVARAEIWGGRRPSSFGVCWRWMVVGWEKVRRFGRGKGKGRRKTEAEERRGRGI